MFKVKAVGYITHQPNQYRHDQTVHCIWQHEEKIVHTCKTLVWTHLYKRLTRRSKPSEY